jgi:hypothetical protein
MATNTDDTGRKLLCYRCGADLSRLTLPVARLDLCPECSVELHVCRMCTYFAPSLPRGCTEDDAEEVHEKARANFCDYFRASYDAYDGKMRREEQRARGDLAALFGDDSGTGESSGESAHDDETEAAIDKANALFDR